MTTPLNALEQLLALSEAMLGAAERQDWETLATREAERRTLSDSLPDAASSQLATAEHTRARRLIEACLHCDERIQPLVARRLNELRVILREVPAGA
jgi:hypothetical protein